MRIRQILFKKWWILLILIIVGLFLSILISSSNFTNPLDSGRQYTFLKLTLTVPSEFKPRQNSLLNGVLVLEEPGKATITITGTPPPSAGGSSRDTLLYIHTHNSTEEIPGVTNRTFKIKDHDALLINKANEKQSIKDKLFIFTPRRTLEVTIEGNGSKSFSAKTRDDIIDSMQVKD